MAKLKPDTPRNEWLDGRLFVHEYGFYFIARVRSRWNIFLPGWVVLNGDTSYDTENATTLPMMFWTLKGARKLVTDVHEATMEHMEQFKLRFPS